MRSIPIFRNRKHIDSMHNTKCFRTTTSMIHKMCAGVELLLGNVNVDSSLDEISGPWSSLAELLV